MPRKNEPQTNDDIFEPTVIGASGNIPPNDPRVSPGSPELQAAFDAGVKASASDPLIASDAQALDEMAPYRDTDDDQVATPESDIVAIDHELNSVPTTDVLGQPVDFDVMHAEAELAARNREAREMHNQPDNDVGDGDFFVNMAKADEKLQPMAAGTRLVVSCTGAEAKISGSGNPMIVLRVKSERVVSTPDAAIDTGPYKNRTIRDNLLYIPPNDQTGYRGTIWRANQAMRAFGVEPDHGIYRKKSEFMEMLQRKAEELVGAVCEIEIGIDDGTSNGTRSPAIDPATGEVYPPKNTITRYYPYTPVVSSASVVDADLPF